MEDKLIDILQNFKNNKNYHELNAVDDILDLFGAKHQIAQLSCTTCKFYPVDYDNYCSTCINFEKHEKSN